MTHVKLKVVQGRPSGKTLVFVPGEYYFGRGAECHVRPDSEWVSRQHCRLLVTDRGASLRDLGSRNGTLVNGVLLRHERDLAPGDQIQIGPLVLEVAVHPAPADLTPPPAPGDGDALDYTPPQGELDSMKLDAAQTLPELASLPPLEEPETPPPVPSHP